MLESIPVKLLLGTALGFLAGLGIGGGSLLLLWLTMVLGMAYPEARAINLLFFLPCAVCSGLMRWRSHPGLIKKAAPAILSGCAAAAVCAFFWNSLDLELLKKFFGGILIVTGIKELFYRPRKAR